MFKPVPKGSVQEIEIVGFTYKCQLPPVGYGINRITKRLQHIGVRSASTKKKEQKWKPLQLPSDWNQRRKLEISRQQIDADYVDNELEKIRAKWWLHRLCGEWILINGKNVYILPDKGIEQYWMKIKNENLKDAKFLFLPETAAVGSDALDLVIDLYNSKCEEKIDKICQTEENRRFFDVLDLKSKENFNDVLKTNITI